MKPICEMQAVSSWGRLSREPHQLVTLETTATLPTQLLDAAPGLPFGMGRSYGDVCLNPKGYLWQTTALKNILSFDPKTGRLRCESGVLLRDIQRLCLPQGWLLPVTPGTQWVTVGGAIANDIHGKNHEIFGTFGHHVREIMLHRTTGEHILCSPTQSVDWFAATVGGLGLTGVIVEAELQLRRVPSGWLTTETIPYHDLQQFLALADQARGQWEHTVSWIDCTHSSKIRGLFMRANFMENPHPIPAKPMRTVPFQLPFSCVNRFSLKPLNALYYQVNKRKTTQTVDYETFFYPLDTLHHWNRLYGPKGFFQYQCVVPRQTAERSIPALLKAIAQAKQGSVLSVLKCFGEREAVGLLSFPQPGVTLALDFPCHRQTPALFATLDSIVQAAGGRLYPAKDARMSRAMFEAGYPNLNRFLTYRDPGISSGFSRRVMDDIDETF